MPASASATTAASTAATASTARQRANARNARLSTGPRTPEGKARSSMNAVKHGIRSPAPVIDGLETHEEWTSHRDAVVRGLRPVGELETAYAERAALFLWRSDRVIRYEITSTENDSTNQTPKNITNLSQAKHPRIVSSPKPSAIPSNSKKRPRRRNPLCEK